MHPFLSVLLKGVFTFLVILTLGYSITLFIYVCLDLYSTSVASHPLSMIYDLLLKSKSQICL
jgi:hypothetical protein